MPPYPETTHQDNTETEAERLVRRQEESEAAMRALYGQSLQIARQEGVSHNSVTVGQIKAKLDSTVEES